MIFCCSFPTRSLDLLEKWVQSIQSQNIQRPDWYPLRHTRICSEHFLPEMFDLTGQTVRLRENAVPTLFCVSNKRCSPGDAGSRVAQKAAKKSQAAAVQTLVSDISHSSYAIEQQKQQRGGPQQQEQVPKVSTSSQVRRWQRQKHISDVAQSSCKDATDGRRRQQVKQKLREKIGRVEKPVAAKNFVTISNVMFTNPETKTMTVIQVQQRVDGQNVARVGRASVDHSYSVCSDMARRDKDGGTSASTIENRESLNGNPLGTPSEEMHSGDVDHGCGTGSHPGVDDMNLMFDGNIPSTSGNNDLRWDSLPLSDTESNNTDGSAVTNLKFDINIPSTSGNDDLQWDDLPVSDIESNDIDDSADTSAAAGEGLPAYMGISRKPGIDHGHSRDKKYADRYLSRNRASSDDHRYVLDSRTVLKAKLEKSCARNLAQTRRINILNEKVRRLQQRVYKLTTFLDIARQKNPSLVHELHALVPKQPNVQEDCDV